MNDLTIEADEISSTMTNIDNGVKNTVDELDKNLTILSSSNDSNSMLTMSNIESNLTELKDLIDISKKVIMHVYESVITTDLVDSELIGALAKLIEATHINIADYIGLYRQRVSFYDKMKMMAYQQQQKIELMRIKHELDMKKIESKSIQAQPEGMVSYTYEDISKIVNDTDIVI